MRTNKFACWSISSALLVLLLSSSAPVWAADAATPPGLPSIETVVKDATLVGKAKIAVYRKGDSVLLSIPAGLFNTPFFWYSEIVGYPANAAPENRKVGSLLSRFERRGKTVFIRDLTAKETTRAGSINQEEVETPLVDEAEIPSGQNTEKTTRSPIDNALDTVNVGGLIAALAVAAEDADGSVLVDATRLFSGDIPGLTARNFVVLTGKVPITVNPDRSYVEAVRMFEGDLNIHTHLTFEVTDPKAPTLGTLPLSMIVGHSLVFLPEKPMHARIRDKRIGLFDSNINVFETAAGASFESQKVISRFRLEKANPGAEVSDPVKPITFYIGRGVPDRWKPAIKAGIETWLPAFKAAGFSNAIRVLDAPTEKEDPNWSVEDITLNIIRWVPDDHANAMGPQVVDPRSGETLGSHVLVWPGVIDYFAKYYYAVFGTVDPEAASLPLSEEKRGKLLSYIVAHEIGHALGLRHNHLASTAYSVAQMRDPKFANEHGPNSSIMAYGRFNQVAQPGDGVTQLYSVLGPYDYAAIKWAYGDFGKNRDEEQKTLNTLAAAFDQDRNLNWAAGELPEEIEQAFDPRVLKENTGAERIEATKLGVANLQRSLANLDKATKGDEKLFSATYDIILGTHYGMLQSVARQIAGTEQQKSGEGTKVVPVKSAEQKAAIAYLLGDGAKTMEVYKPVEISDRIAPVGEARAVEHLQEALLKDVLDGSKIAILESQSEAEPSAYSPSDLGRDVAEAIWGDLEDSSYTKRMLQRAYIAKTKELLASWATDGAGEGAVVNALKAQEFSDRISKVVAESGDDTVYPAWLRAFLPGLKQRLDKAGESAKNDSAKLHLNEMSVQVSKLIAMAN